MHDSKSNVREFWNRASCGEEQLLPSVQREGYDAQRAERYRLEPYIPDFAGFARSRGLRTLEIGVGLGADHQSFVGGGADMHGVALTPRAIEHTARRLDLFGLRSQLAVGDAENLPFPDESFDLVYSWGVLHHSPDTPKAFQEARRVLRTGGTARIMVYSKWSLIGFMLWLRYGLLRGRPFTSLREIYDRYLESPGTKAYTVAEARALCSGFSEVRIRTVLTHGDLLSSDAGQRHRGPLLSVARRIWPRWLFKAVVPTMGVYMLIECRK